MSLIETYQSCKQLIADNLTEKGVEADATDGLTTLANKILDIEGTPEDELIDIEITIVWLDQDNADLNRPESVTVRLFAGRIEVDSAIISAYDDWAHTFYKLPKYNDGHLINYSIESTPVEWYSTIVNGFRIIEDYSRETTSAIVRKIWADNNNESGARPSSIRMTLSNGQKVTLSENNNWIAVITDLPAILNHEPVTYTWTEQLVSGYQLSNQKTTDTVTTFTNKLLEKPSGPK